MSSREEIQHRVDVMQGWLDGEVIELMLKGSSRWSTFDDEMNIFGWEYGHEYRIKPKPTELYITSTNNLFDINEFIIEALSKSGVSAVKLVEVLE